MAKRTVYIKSTIPSYLTSRVSTDVVIVGHQVTTRLWWELYRDRYELFVSSLVHREVSAGNREFAERRLEVIRPLPSFDLTDDAIELGAVYIKRLSIPESAEADAFHIAIATINSVDFLMTWNLRHIANHNVRRLLPDINAAEGLKTPTICTPEDMLYEAP